MAVLISIEDRDVGNARRGYHATITFTYAGGGARYDEKKEEEIINVLTGKMWQARSSHDSQPDVRIVEYYGYDSGD